MNSQSKHLKDKIEDYSRFLFTLLILSIYFYLGMIINTFLEPSDKYGILIILMLVSISLAAWFAFLLKRWQNQLSEMVEQ
ncbi:YrhC family protein [Aquibacillus kalidii]|uniref:YrhC family protein n=1 Tax=Aquibacillus kalidii TaxID=2762597 RepID=UPI001646ED97|nr:YrhC family protein [Aquibacillus kalidii]